MEVVCTTILFKKNGDALLQLRDNDPNISEPNIWTFPGGHKNKGEKIKDAALRELYEETGYEAKNYKYIGKYIVKSHKKKNILFFERIL